MTLTLLLDLDDTLLDTNMGEFIPAYFQALAKHLNSKVKPDAMLPALMAGTNLMLASNDPTHTLQEVFEAEFYSRLGIAKAGLTNEIDDFYDTVFPVLESVTKRREGTSELVEAAFAKGYRVVIATDPLFPRKAIYHRIRWAGLEPERFELISSFESFHFTKSHPAYYAEILGRLGWPNGPVLMVGNDAERDLAPAQKLGLAAYQVDGASAPDPVSKASRRGNLIDLRAWLDTTDLATLEPSFKTMEAIRATLVSTPAVLQGLTSGLNSETWAHEPTPNDWAMIELACHLRDTEREVHHLQIKTLLNESKPFVPRPDAAVWAKQRKYLNEDGPAAVRDFATARLASLDSLKDLSPEVWAREARHAIFGPTNFMEIVGFMAEHDRMHIQQAWNTLKASNIEPVQGD
jgi:FMN phosphatase YigB (HAD superfamily)